MEILCTEQYTLTYTDLHTVHSFVLQNGAGSGAGGGCSSGSGGLSGGVLEVEVQYQAIAEGWQADQGQGTTRTHVSLSVGVLRATGLKVQCNHMCAYCVVCMYVLYGSNSTHT